MIVKYELDALDIAKILASVATKSVELKIYNE